MAEQEGFNLKVNVDTSGLVKARESTNSLYDALKKVDRGFSSIHGNDALTKSIKSADLASASYIDRLKSEGKTYEANKEQVKLYSDQVSRLKNQQRALESELGAVASKSGKASDAYNIQRAKINETATAVNNYEKKIADAQREVDRLNPNGFNKLVLGAQKVSNASDQMKNKLKSAWESIKVGAGAAAVGIGAVGAAAVSGAKKAGSLQQTYREINNLATLGGEKQTEATRNLSKMQSQARSVSLKYGESQESIAKGYEDLVKRGYSTGQALGALKTEVQASVASNTKFSEVTTVSSQTLEAFGLKAKNSNAMLHNTKTVVNELAYAADATSTGFGDLGIGMSYVGSTAHQAGISLSETASAMGILSNNGLEADKAGTGLRQVINSLNGQIGKLGSKNSILSKMGIGKSDLVDSNGKLKDLSDIFSVLNQKMKGMSQVKKVDLMKSLFGTTGMQAGLILANNTKELDELTNKTKKAGDTGSYVQKLADKNMQTANGSIAQAKASMEDFKIILGAKLLPVLNEGAEKLAKFLGTKDGEQFEKNVAGAISKVTDALIGLMDWSTKNQGAVKAIGIAFAAAFSITKVSKFIVALGEVKTAIKGIKIGDALLNGWDKSLIKITNFKDKLKDIGATAKTVGKGIREDIGGALNGEKLGGALQSLKSAGGFKNLSTAGKVTTAATGIGVAADAGFDIYKGIKDKAGSRKQYQDIGKGAGTAIGGGIGMALGGPAGAAIGATIGKQAGKWAGDASKSFMNGWSKKKAPKNKFSFENLGWSTHNMTTQMSKSLNSSINSAVKSANKQNKAFHKWVDGLTKDFRKTWNSIGRWFGSFGKGLVRGFENVWNGLIKFFKGIIKFDEEIWSTFGKWFGSFGKGLVKGFEKAWDGLVGFFQGLFDKIKPIINSISSAANSIGGVVSGAEKGVGKAAGWVGKKLSGHATGGTMTTSHGAIVGEEGPELAYRPYAKQMRLLGANGAEFARVHSGERILNARDTAKVFNGGIGKGLKLKGYAKGTANAGVTGGKSKVDDSITGKNLTRETSNNWSKISRETAKYTKKTSTQTTKDYTSMRKNVNKQMDNMHSSVFKTAKVTAKDFGKALDNMNDYAKDAMKDTIGQLNKGIDGIDKVLGQFGGNMEVIKPVKFATGSNGELQNDTMAMVNDATTGPRQEAIVRNNHVLIPHGNDRVIPLRKGDQVLNGYQTQHLAHSWGLQHFAKGSGVSHSALKKIADQGQSDPAASFAKMFTSNVRMHGPALNQGTTQLGSNASTQYGNPWSAAMWKVINDAIGSADGSGKGGTRESFLKYAERTFSGVPYAMGAMSKAASDCSGMVAQALSHFGIDIGRSTVNMQESSGVQYLGKSLSKTIPGDLVIFGHGTGAAGHVGIIKNPRTGTMFNETPPHARVTKIADDEGMGYGFYRVKGLHNASSSTAKTKQVKASPELEKLAKNELGAKAIKWIKDNLGDEGSLGGNIGGDGVQRWAGTVKKILGMLGLSTSNAMVNRVLRQINTESGGNPHAKQPGSDPDGDGSGPAMGLMQTKMATFNAFKRKGDTGGIFNGPSNIYAGLNYAKARYGPSLSFLGNGHGYAKGGNHYDQTPFLAGENGPELITANGPVHIDTHEQTKQKVKDLTRGLDNSVKSKPMTGKPQITVNLNFNGNVSSEGDMRKYSNIAKREVVNALENFFNHEEGADPSIY